MPGRTWLVIILFPLTLLQLWGLDPNKSIDKYLLDQWQTSEGLPGNMVVSIVQTPDGYLWLATSNGLARFDGIKFSNIPFVRDEEISPLETAKPITLLVNQEVNLWIGSNIGLTRYCNGRFNTFTTQHGLSENRIRHIAHDMKGNIWISFMSGYVDRFSEGKFIPYNNTHGLEATKINAIVEDRSGNLLFASREKGIFSFREGRFSSYPITGLDHLHIIAMYQDRQGDLWIGTNKGLLRVNPQGTRRYDSRQGLSHEYVIFISEDSERNLWVGTLKGLNRINRKSDGTIGCESLAKTSTVFSLFEDREKSLWIGTENSGILRLKDSKFTSFALPPALEKEIISSIFSDRPGDTWIGSLGGRLFLFRGNHLMETIEPPGLMGTGISAIARDDQGNLWLGTMGKGIFQKKNTTFVQFTTREGLADNLVTSIYRDNHGCLWFSTFNGVSVRYNGGTIKSFQAGDGLSGKVVNNIYEDQSQNIWITTDQGITVLPGGKTTRSNIKYYLPGVPTVSIYEDPSPAEREGPVFWISTDGAGLKRLRLKDSRIYSYTVEQGMATNSIYQFFAEKGNFWLMSSSGILRVSKKELDVLAKRGIGKINCTSFGKAEGMQSTNFHNELSRHSALQTKEGELWFVTMNGISILHPGKIHVNKLPPPVVIESLFIDGRSMPLDRDQQVFTGKKNFIFHFTAPSFLSPEQIRFKYQLQGFNKEWIFLPPGNKRRVNYGNLEPGTYTFRVIACNSDGVWNRNGDSLTFTVKPLFYETLIFKIAVLVVLAALLAAAVYFYKKRPGKEKSKQQEPAQKQQEKEEVNKEDNRKYKSSHLNPIFADECMKKLKYLMTVEKVYCDAEISLQWLAKKISITPHQLSQLINERLNRNFSDFINYHRIEEVKIILESADEGDESITDAAHQVGFNSLTAFYNSFKKYTQMTPSQYRKKVKKKKS